MLDNQTFVLKNGKLANSQGHPLRGTYRDQQMLRIAKLIQDARANESLTLQLQELNNEQLTFIVVAQKEEITDLRKELHRRNIVATQNNSLATLSTIGLNALLGGAIMGLVFLVIKPQHLDSASFLGALAAGSLSGIAALNKDK